MDFNAYINKRVHIVLSNRYAYIGELLSADEDSIVIFDKTKTRVTLAKRDIIFIKELG